MFLSKEDYKTVIGDDALEVIKQSDVNNIKRAESYAIDEIKSYLRAAQPSKTGTGKYDVDAAFEAVCKNRSQQLVMYTCDIALYHLVCWLPKRTAYEIREIRYKRALEWLESVQQGKIILDIPLIAEDETTNSDSVRWGGMDKSVYDW
jgi:phage gp36-like protein